MVSRYGLAVRGGDKILVLAMIVFLVATLGAMLADAEAGDWPGWDEGWALVVFPVGIPVVVSLAVGRARAALDWRLVGLTTLAIWVWGAALFVTWMLVGS